MDARTNTAFWELSRRATVWWILIQSRLTSRGLSTQLTTPRRKCHSKSDTLKKKQHISQMMECRKNRGSSFSRVEDIGVAAEGSLRTHRQSLKQTTVRHHRSAEPVRWDLHHIKLPKRVINQWSSVILVNLTLRTASFWAWRTLKPLSRSKKIQMRSTIMAELKLDRVWSRRFTTAGVFPDSSYDKPGAC